MMAEKMREPQYRDKVFTASDEEQMRYHAAVQVCEFNTLDVFLTIWPVCATYEAKTLDFPLELWEEVKELVDNAVKHWRDTAPERAE